MRGEATVSGRLWTSRMERTLVPTSSPAAQQRSEAATPAKSGSMPQGRVTTVPKRRTASGPATTPARAQRRLTRPGSQRAQSMGTKTTAPRSPMDMKAKLRMVSPREPQERATPPARISTMINFSRSLPTPASPALSEKRWRISRRMMVEMPMARPAPVPTTAMKRVPRRSPLSTGGRYSVAKAVRAVLAAISG